MTETDWTNYLGLWAVEMTYQDSLADYRIDFTNGTEYGGVFYTPLSALEAAKHSTPGAVPEAVYVLRKNWDLDAYQWIRLEGVL